MDNFVQTQNNNDSYPIVMQFVLILLLALLGSLFASLLVQSMSYITGLDYLETVQNLQEDSPVGEKNFIKTALCLGHIFTFIIPSLIFLWAVHKKNWFRAVKLSSLPRLNTILLASLFLIASYPIAQFIFSINKQIPIPQWAIDQEEIINTTISNLLHVNSSSELFFNIFTIALLPAIGEEFLFRGIIQQNFEKILKNPHLAVWITALIFSLIHFQFLGFLPRVFLGAVLGYLFVWTRNLWIPIIAHFLTNAGQILMQYFYQQKVSEIDLEGMESVPIWAILIGFVGVSFFGYLLIKRQKSIH